MSDVKRCYYTGSLMVLASDYDRLELECADLRASLDGYKNCMRLMVEESTCADWSGENDESIFATAQTWCGKYQHANQERDELRAQVEAMRDLLREVAPHFAAPPGLGYLYQQIDIALQVNQMNKYQVKFFYLATGMEGHADIRNYGIIEASSAKEAESKVIEANFPNMSDKDKNFVRGCLTATLVSGNENRPK